MSNKKKYVQIYEDHMCIYCDGTGRYFTEDYPDDAIDCDYCCGEGVRYSKYEMISLDKLK